MKGELFIFISILCLLVSSCGQDCPLGNPVDSDADKFVGNLKVVRLGTEAENLDVSNVVVCHMIAPDSSMISRKATVEKEKYGATVTFEVGLTDGTYRMLYFEYEIKSGEETRVMQYGLGCQVEIKDNVAQIIDKFDKTIQMFGKGTEEDPYIITCGPHLYNLTLSVTDFYKYDTLQGKYFKQVADISLHDASYYCKHESGWIPIGNSVYPFIGTYDGGGHKITNMYSHQEKMCGVGFFGHITNSSIENLTIEKADISGLAGVGGIAGCLMTVTGERTFSSIINCVVKDSKIKGVEGGISIGGVAGMIDMYTHGAVIECKSVDNEIEAEYNAGGIVGGSSAYSLTSIEMCTNDSKVSTSYAGAGGIIGVADTILVSACSNSGEVTGAKKYTSGDNRSMARGVAGICGGAGVSNFTGCINEGKVEGFEGVGGIVGSTRLATLADGTATYNSTYLRYCVNSGVVKGKSNDIGGLCGEAQFGCVASINTDSVSGTDRVGGLVGKSSLSMIHNSVNTGVITGTNYVAGIAALANSAVLATCQNYGEIKGKGTHAAGILGLSGNNTMVHYCGNHNSIVGANSPVGGIVAEIGNPREWTPSNICDVVFGAADIVASFAGVGFAIYEAVGVAGKTVKTIVKAVDIGIGWIERLASTSYYIYGLYGYKHLDKLESLEMSLKSNLTGRMDSVLVEMNSIRKNSKFTVPDGLSSSALNTYSQNIVSLSGELTANESSNEKFNDKINDVMFNRAEKINEMNENREMIYTIVGTISVVTGTVCAIVATLASGGTAVPFIVAGTVAGIAGGVASITKGATDYADNVVIISQGVNTGDISCTNITSSEVGGIVGHLYDRGWVYDCLNTGNGKDNEGGHLVGHAEREYTIDNCLTLGSNWDDYTANKHVIHDENGLYCYETNAPDLSNGLSAEALGIASNYESWSINTEKSRWIIPSLSGGKSFPVPNKSEMMN